MKMDTIKEIMKLINSKGASEKRIKSLIEKEIKVDRERLSMALSKETAYMYDDVFDKVKIRLTK
jgi:hypothetical protein